MSSQPTDSPVMVEVAATNSIKSAVEELLTRVVHNFTATEIASLCDRIDSITLHCFASPDPAVRTEAEPLADAVRVIRTQIAGEALVSAFRQSLHPGNVGVKDLLLDVWEPLSHLASLDGSAEQVALVQVIA